MIRFLARALLWAAALAGARWLWQKLRTDAPIVDVARPHATPLSGEQVDALLRAAGAAPAATP
jgi:hypothetical protein